jgi:hypothetical protein
MINLPILYQNIMFGLPSDLARDAFLWATERNCDDHMLYKAEAFGREVATLVEVLGHLLDMSAVIHGQESHDPDVMSFILKRHANFRYGGNQSVGYVQ